MDWEPLSPVEKGRYTLANILAAYTTFFKLDSIDLDWEYPGRQGAEGNTVDTKDTPNFLSSLTILRAMLPSTARISADWVIMNYDVWRSSSEPGPNGPLHDACGTSTQPDANAVWTAAKFPSCKLVLAFLWLYFDIAGRKASDTNHTIKSTYTARHKHAEYLKEMLPKFNRLRRGDGT